MRREALQPPFQAEKIGLPLFGQLQHLPPALGQGAHMSLPTWGLFMQKVIADGTLGVSANDRFIAPPGMDMSFGCDGGDSDAAAIKSQETIEDYYFE